ncbi:MerR family transcriptional regulator [Dermatophilus congolensis]|uniref:transcriptional regulator FtsR n=1 Tax=Dermatophilus congolensis TaxID=1863 RepID=UPI001AB042D1|nr:MerR family transcriptional regulator [Dermatophilus congolensis]
MSGAEHEETSKGDSFTIGAVVDLLSEEFPDLTISKIRFLESKQLVTPARSPSGYRHFRTSDVKRIRYILRAQRDNFWPLKVIREALDAMDRGLEPAPTLGSTPTAPPVEPPSVPGAAELLTPPSKLRITLAELAQSAHTSEAYIESLVGYGLIVPDEAGHVDGYAIPVATSAAVLASYGLEPRHLRTFRTAAEREVGLAQQLNPRHDDDSGEERLGEMLHEFLTLHAALVQAGVARSRHS